MLSLLPAATAALLFACTARSHFTVQFPPPIGEFKDEEEGTGPCGGYTPDLASLDATDFHVDGDAIATFSSHPQTDWLFRITADNSASGNWTEIYDIVQQSGPGNYCTPAVTVPSEWVGKKAILNLVANGLDGMLYQCSAVNFVEGSTERSTSDCQNGTGVQGAFTTDDTLSSLTGETTSTTETPTSTPSAAVSMRAVWADGLGSAALTVCIMAVVGAMLMI
ncbi:hypothetical protein F4778DRAFT_778820 [Xylariomycetidae sp. FL2044]|nr:hypothetical protein F4778DRAFT_778820 [Xylariomycetidae sp. FL2044]